MQYLSAPKSSSIINQRQKRLRRSRTRIVAITTIVSIACVILAAPSLAKVRHHSFFAAFFSNLTATISTDKDDYAPGDTVTITGNGFQPLEPVALVLHENSPSTCLDRTFTSYADADGNFTNTDFAPEKHDVGAHFTLTATGQWSGLTVLLTMLGRDGRLAPQSALAAKAARR